VHQKRMRIFRKKWVKLTNFIRSLSLHLSYQKCSASNSNPPNPHHLCCIFSGENLDWVSEEKCRNHSQPLIKIFVHTCFQGWSLYKCSRTTLFSRGWSLDDCTSVTPLPVQLKVAFCVLLLFCEVWNFIFFFEKAFKK
jgi:hypothetical protein